MTNEGSPMCAVLVVSFGTSYLGPLRSCIEATEQAIALALPGYHLHRAFTSQMIIDKLKRRDGLQVDTVPQALEALLEAGVRQLVVQPTHIMNGHEYDKMAGQLAPYRARFERVWLGEALLTRTEDYRGAVEALIRELPAAGEDEAIVLMGHGTGHFANATYSALEYVFRDLGHERVFVGTVEGFPDFEAVKRRLARAGARRVTLLPFMLVAGDHALNDMAGDGPDSWRGQLAAQGLEVTCLLKGLGEMPDIRALFAGHAQRAIAEQGA